MLEISVAQGLAELKLLDKKIEKRIRETSYCTANKKGLEKVMRGTMTREEYKKEVESTYQSLKSLIENRDKIKSAIVQSNAKTKVKLCGEEYTVADLIERKNAIKYKESLVDELKRQLNSNMREIENENSEIEEKGHAIALNMVGSDKKTGKLSDDAINFLEQYKETQSYELVDPLNIRQEIKELEEEIEDFKANVDWVLTQSNVSTLIQLDVESL